MMSLPVVPITSPWWRRFSRFAVIAGKKWKESERSEPRTSKQQDAGISNSKQAEAPPLFDFDFSAFWRSCLQCFQMPWRLSISRFFEHQMADGRRWQDHPFFVWPQCVPPHIFFCVSSHCFALACLALISAEGRWEALESFQRTPQHVFEPLWFRGRLRSLLKRVVGSLCDARFIY